MQRALSNLPATAGASMAPDYHLDIVGVLEGTDKSSAVYNAWDYLRKYQMLFGHLRDHAFNLIEIGVMGGTSLKVWQSFFPRATIVGVDINPNCARHASGRIKVEIGSQDDPAFLARLCAAYPPTIVIDDGSHMAHHVIYTFERIYPAVLPGGFYVVEDLSFHFGDRAAHWRSVESESPLDYFGAIIRSRMARSLAEGGQGWGTQKHVFSSTDTVTAIDSAVIFHKRPVPGAIEDAAVFATNYLADRERDSGAYLRLAAYYHRHWGVTEQALQAARIAATLRPKDASSARQLVDVLAALGKLDEAEAVASDGADRFSGDAAVWASLGLIRFRQSDLHGAETAMLKALAIAPENAVYAYRLSVILDGAQRHAEAWRCAEAACSLAAREAPAEKYVKHAEALRAKVQTGEI